MNDTQPPLDPTNLVFLRRLVTVLTTVMIVGVVAVVGLLVIRLQDTAPILPENVVLPDGADAVAITAGAGWYAIVTDADEILIYDQLTGELRQTIAIE